MSSKLLLAQYTIPHPTQSGKRTSWYLVGLAVTTFILYGIFTCCQMTATTNHQPKITLGHFTYPEKMEPPTKSSEKLALYATENGADMTNEEALRTLRDITERDDRIAMLGFVYDHRRALFCEKLGRQLQALLLSTDEESDALIQQYYTSMTYFFHAVLRLYSDRKGICKVYMS
ncbi:hypothetical protein IWQ61_005855 [Dispira simplex]|nr:hypothetical protein IWQ61_005855 [Dispira simplex]